MATIFIDIPENKKDKIWIAEENSSGAEYPYDGTKESIETAIVQYIEYEYTESDI